MLQSTTPHAAESKPSVHSSDELESLGTIYFDRLLRTEALRSISLSGLAKWGEVDSIGDQRVFIPLTFEETTVGSIELRFDQSTEKQNIFNLKRQVAREIAPLMAAFLAWTKASFSQRMVALQILSNLKKKFSDFDWLGIYRVADGTESLVVSTYIGDVTEHVRIPLDRGICGAAVRENQTVNVPDVLSDPRFIACSVKTRSELVVPIRNSLGMAIAEIDIDSNRHSAFTAEKVAAVQAAANKLAPIFEA